MIADLWPLLALAVIAGLDALWRRQDRADLRRVSAELDQAHQAGAALVIERDKLAEDLATARAELGRRAEPGPDLAPLAEVARSAAEDVAAYRTPRGTMVTWDDVRVGRMLARDPVIAALVPIALRRVAELELAIAEHADDICGSHPAQSPADNLALVAAHELAQRNLIVGLEAAGHRLMQADIVDAQRAEAIETAIAAIAARFGADPSQPAKDDLATINRGITELQAKQKLDELAANYLERELADAQPTDGPT